MSDNHRIRPLRSGDVDAVATLWAGAFQHGRVERPEALGHYLREVFLEQPFADPRVSSLVCEDGSGAVVGFVGAMPRRLRHRKRELLGVVATQLVVRPGVSRAFVAFDLLRTLFSGPQDVTYSDGANDLAQRVWERVGGEVARLYCLDWQRVLRPSAFTVHLLARGERTALWRAARRACEPFDALATRVGRGPFRRPAGRASVEAATEDDVLSLLPELGAALVPDYDAQRLGWLLAEAARTQGHGELRRRLVRDRSGAAAGWYVYYAKPNDVSHVLQLGFRPSGAEAVLEALLADAYEAGSLAVTGQAEPRAMRELSDTGCTFTCKSLGVLVQARDVEIVRAVQRGDALLSRLDGEWWLRFGTSELRGRA